MIVKASEPVITCQCIRVPVLNGHTAAVFVKIQKETNQRAADREAGKLQGTSPGAKPSKCSKAVYPVLRRGITRPQVTLDVDYEHGMGISVGRLMRIPYTTTSLWDFPITL